MFVSKNIVVLASLFLVLLQPWTITADILSPLLAPIFEDACNDVKCGQGICKPSNNNTIPYECDCSPGWKQIANFDDDNRYLKALPCVIPNCTLNYSCSEAPAPVQEKQNRGNESVFDVCSWTDCGGGQCQTTSFFTHTCECNEGYSNLLNLTFSPCFKDCSLGLDCKNLGLGMTNRSSSSPPTDSSADRSNHANFILSGSLEWLIFAFTLLALY